MEMSRSPILQGFGLSSYLPSMLPSVNFHSVQNEDEAEVKLFIFIAVP